MDLEEDKELLGVGLPNVTTDNTPEEWQRLSETM